MDLTASTRSAASPTASSQSSEENVSPRETDSPPRESGFGRSPSSIRQSVLEPFGRELSGLARAASQSVEQKTQAFLDDFQDLSETDQPCGGRYQCLNWFHDLSRDIVTTSWFDNGMSLLIAINSVLIGVEQQRRNDGVDTTWVERAESAFLVAYTIEVVLRLFATNAACFKDRWFVFEATLVVVGLLEALEKVAGEADGSSAFGVMRVLSLLRMFRTVRLFRRFHALWKLLQSFLNSMITLGWILIMLLLVLYVFACIGMQIIGAHPLRESDEKFADAVDQYFPHLPGTMLTLVQFVTLDNTSDIYAPLIAADAWLSIYFLSMILIVSTGLMNLVTAAIVNSAVEQHSKDKEFARAQEEKEKKAMLKRLEKLFRRIDVDGSGCLSQDEICSMDEAQRKEILDVLKVEDPLLLFEELDVDKDGQVPLDEFCQVLWQESVSKVPVELRRVDKGVTFIRKEFEKMREIHKQTLESLEKSVATFTVTEGVIDCARSDFHATVDGTMKPSAIPYLEATADEPSIPSVDAREVQSPPALDSIEARWTYATHPTAFEMGEERAPMMVLEPRGLKKSPRISTTFCL
eukprot:TRINITY_DN5401_c0_g1_i2.p1 TRINITY_DN5401_c0_g1~~TRINITY_DN5401_c0_g1_i2.p1  ORF type:complete len:625 (-),score=83.97 TRINITY_DN5401_c0_g1_i2:408-2144(-)